MVAIAGIDGIGGGFICPLARSRISTHEAICRSNIWTSKGQCQSCKFLNRSIRKYVKGRECGKGKGKANIVKTILAQQAGSALCIVFD